MFYNWAFNLAIIWEPNCQIILFQLSATKIISSHSEDDLIKNRNVNKMQYYYWNFIIIDSGALASFSKIFIIFFLEKKYNKKCWYYVWCFGIRFYF
jgi:hypothetical protein